MRFAVPPFNPTADGPCFCRSGKTFGQCCGDRSEQRSLPAGIQVFRNFLDADTCQKWVKRLEKQSRVRATTSDINSTRQGALTFKYNPARVCENVNPGVLRVRILEVIERGYQQAVAGTPHTLAWFEFPNILRYEPGGFYRKHADACLLETSDQTWYKVQDRDLSLLLYLNEDFEGGGLTFINFNFHFRPKTGDLLIFPSDNRYEHQAEKVETGLRYCIASWAALQGTRKVFDKPPEAAVPFSRKA